MKALLLLSVVVMLGGCSRPRQTQIEGVADCWKAGAVKVDVYPDGRVGCWFENPILANTGAVAPPGQCDHPHE